MGSSARAAKTTARAPEEIDVAQNRIALLAAAATLPTGMRRGGSDNRRAMRIRLAEGAL